MMPKRALYLIALGAILLPGCHKNQKLGTVGVDLYIHPESASYDDVILQTAIRRKLEDDPLISGHVYTRVSERRVVLTGTVPRQSLSDKAGQIATATRIVVDNDPPIAAEHVTNLIKLEK